MDHSDSAVAAPALRGFPSEGETTAVSRRLAVVEGRVALVQRAEAALRHDRNNDRERTAIIEQQHAGLDRELARVSARLKYACATVDRMAFDLRLLWAGLALAALGVVAALALTVLMGASAGWW